MLQNGQSGSDMVDIAYKLPALEKDGAVVIVVGAYLCGEGWKT